MVRVASYNVENLFARPKAFNTSNWSYGKSALDAFYKVNMLLSKATYSQADKKKIRDLFVKLDIYTVNSNGAIRRKYTSSPKWAWLEKTGVNSTGNQKTQQRISK